MNHGSLFSGIGGFDLAAEWMGWRNVFNCEIDQFCRKVLNFYWPNTISYEDITKTDFTIHRGAIDVLTGGFPCQPFSTAGKRRGTEDNRYLWPEMLRAIREIAPPYVVGENVYGLINWNGGLVLETIIFDLENEGYEILPVIIPACGKDAPHKRERIWFIGYSKHNGLLASQKRRDEQESSKQTGTNKEWQFKGANSLQSSVNTNSPNTRIESIRRWKNKIYGSEDLTNSFNKGLQRDEQYRKYKKENYRRKTGSYGSTSEFYRSSNWEKWPTVSPLCFRDDGISTLLDRITIHGRKGTRILSKEQAFSKIRVESIKAGGNAVVPQIPYEIFKIIDAIHA